MNRILTSLLALLLYTGGVWAKETPEIVFGDPTIKTHFSAVTSWSLNWSERSNAQYPDVLVRNAGNYIGIVENGLEFTSSDPNVAVIAMSKANTYQITPIAPGATVITVSFAGNDQVEACSNSYVLTYVDDRSGLDGMGFGFSASTASATYGDATVNSPTLQMGQLSGASVTYSSSKPTVATVDGNSGVVTIVAAGVAEISATYAGDAYFMPGSVSYTLNVDQKEVGLSWSSTSFTYDGNAHLPTATATGLIGSDVCTVTVSGAQTNAGSYTATASGLSNGNYKLPAANTVSFTIAKATPTVTAPTAKTGLAYNGAAQALVNAGSTTGGTMEYSLDGTTYSTTIPSAANVGIYTVYYRVAGNVNYNDVAAQTVTVTIAASQSAIATAPTVKTGLVYNGSAQALMNAGTATNGTMQYSSDGTTFSTIIPTATNAGSYDVWYMVKGNTGYNDVAAAKLTAIIAKATPTVTAPIGKTLNYTGAALALVNAGSTTGGTLEYSLDGTTYSTAIPSATNVGTYTVYYRVVGNANYNDVAPQKLTVSIAKADVKVLYENYEFTAKLGEAFYPPHVTVEPAGLPLTYWSSDPDVANVDAQTGEVTLNAPGRVNIYAEFPGDENYNSASDYYILTVEQYSIEPINEDVTITMKDEDFIINGQERKLDNTVIYDILFTLNITGDPSESDGYDETLHGVVLNTPMSKNDINRVITRGLEPGTEEYADEYTGLTFKVPAGKGYVIIESQTDEQYQMMVKIGNLEPVAFHHTGREKDSVLYECSAPTWVYVYNGGTVSNARMNAIPKAKKTKGHVIIYSVTRKTQKNVAGIEQISCDALDENERWYDLQGNRINRPTKKGVYILRGQKVVVK